MTAALKLAQELKKDPRAGLEAVRLELKWKVQFYQSQIKNLETMVQILEEGIKEVTVKLSEVDDQHGTEGHTPV
jgi:hypothetical protein